MPGESPALPICRRKDWFLVGWFVLVDHCHVWYLLGTCIWLYGVTCENSISGESYLNSSWDNKDLALCLMFLKKVPPFLKCQCYALRINLCKVPCRFIIGFGLYNWQWLGLLLEQESAIVLLCRHDPIKVGFALQQTSPFSSLISENTGPEKMWEAHGP